MAMECELRIGIKVMDELREATLKMGGNAKVIIEVLKILEENGIEFY